MESVKTKKRPSFGYAKFFISKPARSCFAVKDLPKGALCEIECVAEA